MTTVIKIGKQGSPGPLGIDPAGLGTSLLELSPRLVNQQGISAGKVGNAVDFQSIGQNLFKLGLSGDTISRGGEHV